MKTSYLNRLGCIWVDAEHPKDLFFSVSSVSSGVYSYGG